MGVGPVNVTGSNVPETAEDRRNLYVPGSKFGSRSNSKAPASVAGPLTSITEGVLVESISMCTRLPIAPPEGPFRDKLPKVSVCAVSGEIVPELTDTFPVRVPLPLKVPLCVLKPMFLQTETEAPSI